MKTARAIPLALLSLVAVAATAVVATPSRADDTASFETKWTRALRSFDRKLAKRASYLRAEGARVSARQALDYGSNVSVCRTNPDGEDSCVGILDANEPICHSTGCQCTWTACNNFAATCAEHGFNQTTCTISVNESGYPIGLGCGCHAVSTDP